MGNQISGRVNSGIRKLRGRQKRSPSAIDTNANTHTDEHTNDTSNGAAVSNLRKGSLLDRPLPSIPAKVRVRALYSFPGVNDNDLPFKKGDIMEVDEGSITDENDWWFATHTKTKKQGYIPSNYIVKDDATPQSQDWWFDYDRHDADKNLLLPGNGKGTFLIRQATDHTSYVLSVLDVEPQTDDLRVKHYRIRPLDDGGFYISPSKVFSDLFELIEWYKSPTAKGLTCPLTVPCPRIRPSLQFRELEVNRESVKLDKRLGQGCFGEVWRGKFRKVVDVAVKTLKPGTMSSEEFLNEARFMHALKHPRLVQLMAVVSTSEPFYIITELMHNGALLDFLRSDQGKRLKFNQLIDMNSQIADGMAYLESQNYIHRDLRAANVLVGERFDVKVADFGLARMLQDNVYSPHRNTKFPIKWTAPEAANHSKFSTKSDVWSFGVLMYEIITFGKIPYPGQTGSEVLKMVEKGERMEKPQGCAIEVPDSYYEMMLKCWSQKPENRPTFESLHDFFDDYFINVEPNYRPLD